MDESYVLVEFWKEFIKEKRRNEFLWTVHYSIILGEFLAELLNVIIP